MERALKLVIVNGSPRSDKISNTYKALMAEKEFILKERPDMEVVYFKLPINMQGCVNCTKCNVECNIRDDFSKIVKEIEDATCVMLGTPVYLDMPTPQMVAFLTRLNCKAENTERKFFKNKKVYLVATSFCSGTKTAIHTMMGACEMLGFTIDGRSTREYICLWKDNKLRGGMTRGDAIYIDSLGDNL